MAATVFSLQISAVESAPENNTQCFRAPSMRGGCKPETVQATKMVDQMTYRDRLRELGLFSLEKGRLKRHLFALSNKGQPDPSQMGTEKSKKQQHMLQ